MTVRWGHWMMAHAASFQRDDMRLRDLMPRVATLPLGSGALAGNPFLVDRQFLAKVRKRVWGCVWGGGTWEVRWPRCRWALARSQGIRSWWIASYLAKVRKCVCVGCEGRWSLAVVEMPSHPLPMNAINM